MTIAHLMPGPTTIAGPAESKVACGATYEVFPNSFAAAGDYTMTVRNAGGAHACSLTIQAFDAGNPGATPPVAPAPKPGASLTLTPGASGALPATLAPKESYRISCAAGNGCEYEWMVNKVG